MGGEVYEGKGSDDHYVFHHRVGEHFSRLAGDARVSGGGQRVAGVDGGQHGGGLDHSVQSPSVSSLADHMDTLE